MMAFEDDDFLDALDEDGLYEEISKLKIYLEEKSMIIDTLALTKFESNNHFSECCNQNTVTIPKPKPEPRTLQSVNRSS